MAVALIIGAWIVFVLLVIYTILSKLRVAVIDDLDTIRRAWYLIFLLGCLIYITNNPTSLFNGWKNYLIVLIVFVVIDSLLFLNLYFSKFGGHELKTTKRQVDITEKHLELTKRKIYSMEEVLNSYEYLSYTESRDEYIQGLDDFLNEYAEREALYIDVLPYKTDDDKQLTSNKKERKKIERTLSLRKTYYYPDDQCMLVPLWVLDEDYVVKVSTNSNEDVKVHDVDVNVINMMLMVYVLVVKEDIE